MEPQVSKWCFECAYVEILCSIDIDSKFSLNLTKDVNLICMHCHKKTIRLEIEVVDTAGNTNPRLKDR